LLAGRNKRTQSLDIKIAIENDTSTWVKVASYASVKPSAKSIHDRFFGKNREEVFSRTKQC